MSGGEIEGAPLIALLKEVIGDTATLARQEVTLLRAELREDLRSLHRFMIGMLLATAVAGIGLALLAAAAGQALAWNQGWPSWVGHAIAGAGLFAAGAAAIGAATHILRGLRFGPERTAASLKEDIRWIRRRATSTTTSQPPGSSSSASSTRSASACASPST